MEHTIANLNLLPLGLANKARADPEFWTTIGQSAAIYPALTTAGALHNVIVATISNLIGGSLMVGAVYWFVYLRGRANTM
jgi:formate/nitrite transporter FocA (FNT family)